MYVYTYTHIHMCVLEKLTKYPFSLCKSACVLQWVTGILTDGGLKY